jgi:hypothetical protein
MERHDHDCPVGGLARPRCCLRRSTVAGPAHPNRVTSDRGRFPNAHQDELPVGPRGYALEAAYLPREVFFGRFAFAAAFLSVWARDFGRFFPATSGSFRLIGSRPQ